MTSRLMLLMFAALAAACTQQREVETPKAPLVRVFEVRRAAAGALELRGSVAAESRVRLGFKQAGVVAAVLVREGDRVVAQQLLARLDDVDARAAVAGARAAADKAQRDAARAQRLAGEGALPTSAHDDAQNQLEATEARLVQAQDALTRTELRAPLAGTIFKRLAEPGETLASGSPIVVLDTTGTLVIKAGTNERELRRLRLGQRATLVSEEGDAPLEGRVTSLATTPNPEDGLYAVEVTPAGVPAQRLRPGSLLRVQLEPAQQSDVLRIPLEALVHRQDRDYVFVLEAGAAGLVAHLRGVEIGEAEASGLVVRSGLSGGERIVAEGAYFLQDGQAVRVLD
jgi:RND family efflux transporter MFP subunit